VLVCVENLDEEVAARQIFSLGEVCQACSRHITKRHHLLAQSFVAATLVSGTSDFARFFQMYRMVVIRVL
jgi:hypothetical protein